MNVDTGEMPDKLHHVGIETRSNDNCGDYPKDMITENMICAGGQGKDSCWGDSGGN
jgi:secreted trypsin-like serine protease